MKSILWIIIITLAIVLSITVTQAPPREIKCTNIDTVSMIRRCEANLPKHKHCEVMVHAVVVNGRR